MHRVAEDQQQQHTTSHFQLQETFAGRYEEPPKTTLNDFEAHQLLGCGSFGKVYLVQHTRTKRYHAMKVLKKGKILKHQLERYALTERNILCTVRHPFVMRLNFAI